MEEENFLIIPCEMKKKNKKRRNKIEVKMEMIVPQDSEKTVPLVGYFPSGFDPHKVSNSDDDEPTKVRVFRHIQKPNRFELVVTPNATKVDFVGTSYTGEAMAAQACTYALGVLDKETQSLKIVPIASNKIFRLEPRVRGLDVYDNELSKESKEEKPLTAEERLEKLRDTDNKYGTKKVINKAKKKAILHRKEDENTQKGLQETINLHEINKEALESAGAFMPRNIPHHDATATTPEKAYPLDKIILQGEWDYLLDVLECVESNEQLTAKDYPSFVCNRAHNLMKIKNEEDKKTLACIYSYISHLIKFKDKHSMDNAASSKSHRIPDQLYNKFFKTFHDDLGRKEPSLGKKDLLISYVLVLSLIADGYKTDPMDISKDLRMNPLSLREYYNNLGCKLARVKGQMEITLPLPIQFPKMETRRRKRY